MAQRVKEMVSEEIIDEGVVKKEVEEAKKELKEENKEEPRETKGKKTGEKKPSKQKHGRKYLAAQAKIDPQKVYTLDEAIEKVLETSVSRFDGTVEFHAKLVASGIRGTLVLPAGAPKAKKIVEITDENVDDIIAKIKSNKLDFDILVAMPRTMPKLAAVAKILGPKGLMPSPKTGTVVENTAEAAAEFKIGKVEYKQDDQKNIHMGIGKISWGKEKIKENLETIIKVLPKNKILAFYLTSTMGPSVKMELPR